MAVPSLSQHFLITSLLREEPVPGAYFARLGRWPRCCWARVLVLIAGRLYRREALLG